MQKNYTCSIEGCNKKSNLTICPSCQDIFTAPNKIEGKEKFVSREGRTIHSKMLVGVHWNAHKKVWSIVRMNSRKNVGLVLGYADEVTLRDVTTHIDKAKQKKVLNSPTNAKDRHAFMVGYIESLEYEALERPIYYKPQQVKNFVDAENFFKHGLVSYIEHEERVSLKWDEKNNRPCVTYNGHPECSCDDEDSKFYQEHGACEWCTFVGE